MAAPPLPDPRPRWAADGPTVAEIFEKYLGWCRNHRAPRTYEWYRDHIQGFIDFRPAVAHLAASDLHPFHVVEWCDSHPDWSPAYRRGAIVAIQRPLNSAEELGYVPSSPAKKLAKPQPQRRENHITPDDFAVLLDYYPEGDPFRDLLLFAWHSGCRPQEVRRIEARHVRYPAECVVLPKEEAKGKRRPRVIHLHGPALDVIARLLTLTPDGPLFRNEDGAPWTKSAIAKRFERFQLSYGIARLKELGILIPPLPRFNRRGHADKVALAEARREQRKKLKERRAEIYRLARLHVKRFGLYDLRHGFAQRLLEGGANPLVVAELMGHSNGTTVATVYQHMNKATAHLKDALRKGAGGGSS
jgi:integrase